MRKAYLESEFELLLKKLNFFASIRFLLKGLGIMSYSALLRLYNRSVPWSAVFRSND
jgi:hypothetical protein